MNCRFSCKLMGALSATLIGTTSTLAVDVPLPAPTLVVNAGGVYTETLTTLDVLNNGFTRPPDNPSPPGDVFNPAFTPATTNANAPAIATFTTRAESGQSFNLFGARFDGARVRVFRQTSTNDAELYEANRFIQQPTGLSAALLGGRPYGVQLVWVENAVGTSCPVRLNAAQAWWLGPDHVCSGESTSLFGVQLSRFNNTNTSYIYVRPWSADASVSSIPCTVTTVNPYKVTFTIPTNLPPNADYEVWVHNGHGGAYGWSGPLKLHVDASPRYVWNGPVRTVPAPSGTNDAAAIQAVFNAAQAGDTVRFDAGTWLISQPLTCKAGVSIEGQGSLSVISMNSDFSAPPSQYMLRVTIGGSRVRNLSFKAVKTLAYAILYFSGNGLDPIPAGVFVENCNLTSSVGLTHNAIEIAYARDIQVHNCYFEGAEAIWLVKTTQAFVHDNDYAGSADVNTSNSGGNGFSMWAASQSAWERNSARSLDRANGLFSRRFLIAQNQYGVQQDVYIADNSTEDTGPLLGAINQNSGEQILLETGNTDWTGRPSAVNGLTLSFSGTSWTPDDFVSYDRPGWNSGELNAAYLYIQSGPAAGQLRRILSNTTNSLVIDRPWDVPPDTNSFVTIQEMAWRHAIYRNQIHANIDDNHDGIPDFDQRETALVGICTFGTVADLFVAGNRIEGMREGMYYWGQMQSKNEPVASVLVEDNTILNCRQGIRVRATADTNTIDPGSAPILMNLTLRHNTLTNDANLGIKIDNNEENSSTRFIPGSWMLQTIIEQNIISGSATGIVVAAHSAQTLVRANQIMSPEPTNGSQGVSVRTAAVFPLFVTNLIDPGFAQPFAVPTDTSGLLAAWNFDGDTLDGHAADVRDSSGNDLHGSSSGSPTLAAGHSGQAAVFDGIDDFVTLDYPLSLDSFTLSAWFRLDASSMVAPLFASSNIRQAGAQGIGLFLDGGVVCLTGERGTTGNSLAWNVDALRGDGRWHRVEVMYDASSRVAKVYGDGMLKSQTTADLGRIRPLDSTGKLVPFLLGADGQTLLHGALDDVHLYNRALTSVELAAPYARWRLDESQWTGADEEVRDSRPHGLHGRALCGATTARGKMGFAGVFATTAGAAQAVSLPPVQLPVGPFSAVAWFRVAASNGPAAWLLAADGTTGLRFFGAGGIAQLVGTVGSTAATFAWTNVPSFAGDNHWHLAVVTYDPSTNRARLYGDGQLRAEATVVLGDLGPQSYLIGATATNGGGFQGAIDDVSLWDRELSAAEIAALWSGPLVNYRFEEGFDGNPGDVRDSTLNGFHAQSIGGLNSTNGARGKAVSFSGQFTEGEGIDVPWTFSHTDFTASVWFRVDGSGNDSNIPLFQSRGYVPSGTVPGVEMFYIGSQSRMAGERGSTLAYLSWNASQFSGDSKWHHAALTYDSASTTSIIYGDGVERMRLVRDLGDISPRDSAGKPLGYLLGAFTSSFFKGALDEFRIYDRVLSAAEVTQLKNFTTLDDTPIITITAEGSPAEKNSVPGSFVLCRQGDLTQSISVSPLFGGSASGTDYTLASTLPVVLPAGVEQVQLTIVPIADLLTEGPETVTATLSTNPTYRIGSSDTASLTIADTPPTFLNISLNTGKLLLQINGSPGFNYTLQASTNFMTWTNLFTTNPAAGVFNWTDENLTNASSRFYRVLVGP